MNVQIEIVALHNSDKSVFPLEVVHTSTRHGTVIIPVMVEQGMGNLMLVEQNRPAVNRRSVEFPRGSTTNLSAEEATRELLEETGVANDQILNLFSVGTLHPDTGLLSTKVQVYIALLDNNALTHEFQNPDENNLKTRIVPMDEARRLLARSGCAISLAAYALAEEVLDELY